MQFIHQALAWGLLLAILPILIHLINLLRHRRVKWAAMDFLLQSHQKNRRWVWLRQFLLLLMRVAAIILAVVMLAKWVTREQWFTFVGGKETHHYLVLDDSLSMSERQGGTTAFDLGLQTVGHVVTRAMQQETRQRITLLRYSRALAARATSGTGDAAPATATPPTATPDTRADALLADVADLNGEPVGSNFDLVLEEVRRRLFPSQRAIGPVPALKLVQQLAQDRPDENQVIYLISDFRDADWKEPADYREALRDLASSGAEIRLVSCARSEPTNLAVTRIAPAEETQAAGVPLFIHVTVRNFGSEPARKVTVKIRSTYYDPDLASSTPPAELTGEVDEPPSILIDEIPAGESVTRRVQVLFAKPGQHVVEAILPDDALVEDNRRWTVVEILEAEPILVVDGDPEGRNGYFLSSVFQPGARAVTGIVPDLKPVGFLRGITTEQLSAYRAVYLLDVDQLEKSAIDSLESYVRTGGGLAIFVGERLNVSAYNENLYRSGRGLMPLPLERDDFLRSDPENKVPDIEVTEHPIFEPFLGERNPLIRLVAVERFLRPPRDWQLDPESGTAIIARLRNRWPLVCERSRGEGRVVVFLTTLAPLTGWNNWGNDPSFVVTLLRLQSYLAAAGRILPEHLVGAPLRIDLDAEKFRPAVTFVRPAEQGGSRLTVERTASKVGGDAQHLEVQLGAQPPDRDVPGETDVTGVYEGWLRDTAGNVQVRRFAINVDPRESPLALVQPQQLLTRLEPVRAQFMRAEEVPYDSLAQAGYNHSMQILWLLLLLLLGEQWMAYSSSYHPPRGATKG